MITLLVAKLPRWASTLVLVLLAVLVLPSVALAVATSDVVNMFKYTYGVERLLYMAAQEIVLWRILGRKKKPIGGRGQWIMPVQTRNTGVFRGHAEGGAKTTRRAQPATAEASFSLQEFHGVWNATWKMLTAARKDEYAFARAVDFMDNSFKRRVFRRLNAEMNGTGRGELAILPAADDDTVVTVNALPFADMGSIVDVMDLSDDNALIGDGLTVTAIDVPNRTVTLSGALAGSAAGDYLTEADTISISGGSMHMLGLIAWADDDNPSAVVGNAGGINRSTAGNDWWKATVLSNSGTLRPMNEDLMLQGLDIVRERGGTTVTDWISNLAIIRRYHESLRADTFFALSAIKELSGKVGIGRDEAGMKSGEESGGETIYQMSGIPWRAEMFFRANTIVGLNRANLYIGHGENEVPRPLSEVFDVDFFTPTDNADFDVLSYWEGEVICEDPTSLIKYEDIAES